MRCGLRVRNITYQLVRAILVEYRNSRPQYTVIPTHACVDEFGRIASTEMRDALLDANMHALARLHVRVDYREMRLRERPSARTSRTARSNDIEPSQSITQQSTPPRQQVRYRKNRIRTTLLRD